MQKLKLRLIMELLICGFFSVLALFIITYELDTFSNEIMSGRVFLFSLRNLLYLVLYVLLSVGVLTVLDKTFINEQSLSTQAIYLYFPVILYIILGFMLGNYIAFAIAAILGLIAYHIPKKIIKKRDITKLMIPRIWIHSIYFVSMFILTFILTISRLY